MENKIEKIKEFNQEEMSLFSKMFPSSSITLVKINNVDETLSLLTSSEELRQKTISMICCSGALVCCSGALIERGIILYRYDEKDKATPINVDLYPLNGSILYKIQPPFSGHRLDSLPRPFIL